MKFIGISFLFFFTLLDFTPFAKAAEKAKEENKQILLVFSGSDWCHGCISFKKNVTDTEDFLTYSKESIVYYLADFPRSRDSISEEQITENQRLAELYNKKGAFPYLVLFNKKGKVVKSKKGGFKTFAELRAWVEN